MSSIQSSRMNITSEPYPVVITKSTGHKVDNRSFHSICWKQLTGRILRSGIHLSNSLFNNTRLVWMITKKKRDRSSRTYFVRYRDGTAFSYSWVWLICLLIRVRERSFGFCGSFFSRYGLVFSLLGSTFGTYGSLACNAASLCALSQKSG